MIAAAEESRIEAEWRWWRSWIGQRPSVGLLPDDIQSPHVRALYQAAIDDPGAPDELVYWEAATTLGISAAALIEEADGHLATLPLISPNTSADARRMAARLRRDAEIGAAERGLDEAMIQFGAHRDPQRVADAANRLHAARNAETDAGPQGEPLGGPGIELDPALWKVDKLMTGIPWWDDIIHGGGMEPGWVIGISAEAKCGKSALAAQVALRAMLRNDGLNVVWAMGEMTTNTLRLRAMQHLGQLTESVLETPTEFLAEHQAKRKLGAIAAVDDIGRRMRIVPLGSIPEIEAEVIATGAGIAVIDYLQRIKPSRNLETTLAELEDISGEIVDMAKRTKCVVLLPSALSIGATKGERINVQAAFRGAGKVANDVDAAVVLVNESPDRKHGEPASIAVRCVAHRHCEARTAVTLFDGALMTFRSAAGWEAPR